MNIKTAAKETLEYVPNALLLPARHSEYGRDHITHMLNQIQEWDLTEQRLVEKANRWIGWAQCAIVIGAGASLEEMKAINKAA